MIPPEEAWRRLEPFLEPLPTERLARRLAGGRVLAEPTAATVDVPPADVSAMDGYAVAGEVAGRRLPVAGTVAAGDPPGRSCPPGSAVRIMTGAAVPTGTDRVVPVELSDGGAETVAFTAGVAAGAHIRRRAEIVAAGDPLLPAGTVITPGALSLLATHGIRELAVHRAPSVRLLVTGDEVVPPDTEPRPGQLRDSHTDFLLAAVRGTGLELENLGIAPDRRAALAEAVTRGLEADVLLLTGGVSMGEYDHVEAVLGELGCTLLFDAVAIQPGKPLVAAHHPGGLVFGLPGNPGSVMAAFWLFVRPALRRLMGHADGFWHGALDGVLAAPLPGAKGRDRFLPAAVEVVDGTGRVRPITSRGSHDLMATAGGDALVRVPAGAEPAEAGGRCEFLPLHG
jgi:molybdopterin molybdotransferase